MQAGRASHVLFAETNLTPLFPVRYKKNLKALYVVHATSFFRRMLKLLKFILRCAQRCETNFRF